MNGNRTLGGPWLLAGILIVFCVVLSVCMGAVGTIPLIIAFGWPWYLGRVVPHLAPDPETAITAAVCLLGVVIGSHFFLRWLYSATATESKLRRWPWMWTFQGVAIVLVMFVAGISVTGLVHQTTWLLTSPEPIVVGGYRGPAARTISGNNLKQIVTAAHNFASETANLELPRSRFDEHGRPMYSWITALLPQMEQGHISNTIDFTKPWDHPDNAKPLSRELRMLFNPNIEQRTVNGLAASHYAGNVHVFLTDRPKRLDSKDFPLGLSNTIFFGEVSTNIQAWGDPLNLRDPHLGNAHREGFNGVKRKPLVAMGDGSTRLFDEELLQDINKVPE